MTAEPVAVALRATTREIEPPDDLAGLLGPEGVAWLHDGVGFVTAGVAARVAAVDAVEVLRQIPHDGLSRPGTGPIAVGALPFDPAAEGSLVVPARVVGRDADGRAWVTELGGAPEPWVPPGPEDAARAATSSGGAWKRRELMSVVQWTDAVEAALGAIDDGALEKVVLARAVELCGDRDIDVPTVVARLVAHQPGCFVYAAEGLVGATPELLVRRRDTRVESRPMAGTVASTDDRAVRRLRESTKDSREHRVVVDAIVEVLGPRCERLLVGADPEVAKLASVAHLTTPVRGTLRAPAPDALALARALHPTPAVGGTPSAAALELLARLEPVSRGRYAGPVGWVDARGDGEWAVALRGAAIDGRCAVLHAGAGIVAGSVPEAEWRETDAKLEPMLRALDALS